ncbi:MAG: hypothetical protein WBB94_00535 [Candidatus Saccharimonadaceae bacterium]
MLVVIVVLVIAVMIALQFISVRLIYRKKIVASFAALAGTMFMFGLAVVVVALADPAGALLLPTSGSLGALQRIFIVVPFAFAGVFATVSLMMWIANWLKVNEVRVARDTTSITLAWSHGGTICKMSQPKGGFTKRLTGREPDLDSNPNPWTPEKEMRKIG